MRAGHSPVPLQLAFATVVAILTACRGATPSTSTSVRLRGGATPWNGRVEVLHEKQWGTVCDTGWDITDGNVTCQQLGFSFVVGVTTMSSYGSTGDDVPVWVEGVDCEGGEGDIGECVRMGEWGAVSSDCENHTRDAGVVCADDPNALNVRLVGGDSVRVGRVEVLFGDEWGGVCDDEWGLEEAAVVCRQLGYDVADNQPSVGEYGEGVGVIWMDDVMCDGDEARLADCRHTGWAEHNCVPSENVGVHCTASDITSNNCSVRLSRVTYLPRLWVGTVELLANDEWGRVCSNLWDTSNADVVCRQLGYHGALEATALVSNPPSELYWLAGVECGRDDDVLCSCPSSHGISYSNCNSTSDAGVTCQVAAGDPYALRLVGGANEWEGRVEVSVNGEWGTVCSLDVVFDDVHIVCRQLGYQRALLMYFGPAFGEGLGVQWFDNFHCSGTESSVFDCPREGTIGQISSACSHSLFDLSVICQAEASSPEEVVPVRLVGGATEYEGWVEVLYNGRWGLVCDDGWDLTAANITCHQLGYGGVISHDEKPVTMVSDTNGPVPFWLDDIMCDGTETALSMCPHSMWGEHDCSPSDAAGLICSERLIELSSSTRQGTPSPLTTFTSSLITTSLMPLPLSSSPTNQPLSLSLQGTPTAIITMATETVTAQATPTAIITMATKNVIEDSVIVSVTKTNQVIKATPTDNLSTSDGTIALQTIYIIVAGLIVLATISSIVTCKAIRLRRKKVPVTDSTIDTNTAASSITLQTGSIPPSSMQHTVLEGAENPPGGSLEANGYSTDLHFTNPHTQSEESPIASYFSSPTSTPTATTPTRSPKSDMELLSLEDQRQNSSPDPTSVGSDTPSASTLATFV